MRDRGDDQLRAPAAAAGSSNVNIGQAADGFDAQFYMLHARLEQLTREFERENSELKMQLAASQAQLRQAEADKEKLREDLTRAVQPGRGGAAAAAAAGSGSSSSGSSHPAMPAREPNAEELFGSFDDRALGPVSSLPVFNSTGGFSIIYGPFDFSFDGKEVKKYVWKAPKSGMYANEYALVLKENYAQQDLPPHPNVLRGVPTYTVVRSSYPSINMTIRWTGTLLPYAEGGDLHSFISEAPGYEGGINMGLMLGMIRGMFEAIAFLHEQGKVHRDIKPANILLAKRLDPCVSTFEDGKQAILCSDFGLVRSVESDGRVQTIDTANMGTPDFTAPEISTNSITDKVDVFALSMVIFMMQTGQMVLYPKVPQKAFLLGMVYGGLRPELTLPCRFKGRDYPETRARLSEMRVSMWAGNPDERPSMRELLAKMDNEIVPLFRAGK